MLESVNGSGALPDVDASGLTLPSVLVDPTTLQQFPPPTAPGATPPPPVSPLTVRGFLLDQRYNYRRDGLPINAETFISLANK